MIKTAAAFLLFLSAQDDKIRLRLQPRAGDRIETVMKGAVAEGGAVEVRETSEWSDDLTLSRRDTLSRLRGKDEPTHFDPRDFASLFPDRDVAVGERWTVESRILNRPWNLAPSRFGRAQVTLKEVKEVDGLRHAVLSLDLDIVEHASESRMRGTAVVRLDRGLLVSMNLQGSRTLWVSSVLKTRP